MEKLTVDQNLADQIVRRIITDTPFTKDSIYCEIQDDFQMLFISIALDDFSEIELPAAFKCVGKILNSAMPKRRDDYSWIVGFKRNGEVVDSCFGGSFAAPDWSG